MSNVFIYIYNYLKNLKPAFGDVCYFPLLQIFGFDDKIVPR